MIELNSGRLNVTWLTQMNISVKSNFSVSYLVIVLVQLLSFLSRLVWMLCLSTHLFVNVWIHLFLFECITEWPFFFRELGVFFRDFGSKSLFGNLARRRRKIRDFDRFSVDFDHENAEHGASRSHHDHGAAVIAQNYLKTYNRSKKIRMSEIVRRRCGLSRDVGCGSFLRWWWLSEWSFSTVFNE